jgi:drug/metabolite transporter (DMT)-like permease
MQKTLAYIAVVFSMIFWAFSFIWSKGALEIYGPLTILTFRLIIASILLLSISKATGLLNPIKKQDWKFFFLLSFFEPFLYFLGETYGLNLVSPTIAAVMIATIPLFLPYMAWYVFGERITKFKTFGSVFSFVGVLLVMVNYNMELNANIWGILLLLLAVASAIGYTAVLNKLSHNYNVFTIVSWQSALGLIGFAPLFALIELPDTLATGWQWAGLQPILLLAIFGSMLAFLLYTHSIKVLGMTRSGVFTNGIPVLTSLFSFLLLGEQLLTINYIGIAIVVGGLFLSQLRERGR